MRQGLGHLTTRQQTARQSIGLLGELNKKSAFDNETGDDAGLEFN